MKKANLHGVDISMTVKDWDTVSAIIKWIGHIDMVTILSCDIECCDEYVDITMYVATSMNIVELANLTQDSSKTLFHNKVYKIYIGVMY